MNVVAMIALLLLPPIYLLVVGFKLLALTNLLYKWNFPLAQIPGPWMASFTRLWWLRLVWRSELDQEMIRLHKNYGPVVRIAPNSILVSNADTTRNILAVGSKFKRGPWFDSLRLGPFTTNVVSERDPKQHQQLRAILSPGLSGNDIHGVESTVDGYVEQYLRMIERNIEAAHHKSTDMDLSTTIPLLTLDIIAHLCLGESFGCIENEADSYGFFKALNLGMLLQQYVAILTEATAVLLAVGKLPWARTWLFPKGSSSNGMGRVMLKVRSTVERRCAERESERSKKDMLDSFLSRGLSINQAASELVIIISSGVGATSYAIQAIVRAIVANAAVMHALQNEIDGVVAGNGGDSLKQMPDSAIKQMPYLQACILEGLRIYPPVFSQLRERVVPPEGALLNGYAIPGGTYVGFNSIGSQLSHIYGDDVEEYHPERWLIDDEVQLKQMRRDLELVFGHGNSECLGINMANLELNKIVFQLFRTYDVSFSNKNKPWKSRGDFVLTDFRVKLRRREVGSITNGVSYGE